MTLIAVENQLHLALVSLHIGPSTAITLFVLTLVYLSLRASWTADVDKPSVVARHDEHLGPRSAVRRASVVERLAARLRTRSRQPRQPRQPLALPAPISQRLRSLPAASPRSESRGRQRPQTLWLSLASFWLPFGERERVRSIREGRPRCESGLQSTGLEARRPGQTEYRFLGNRSRGSRSARKTDGQSRGQSVE